MARKQSRAALIQKAKKILWLGSMVFVVSWLFQARNTVQSRQSIDQYMTALQRSDLVYASNILDTRPMDEAGLLRRLQAPLSPQVAQCALRALIDSDGSYLVTCDEVPTPYSAGFAHEERPKLAIHFLKSGAMPSEDTLAFALGRNQPDIALFCLRNSVRGYGVTYQDPPINMISRKVADFESVESPENGKIYEQCLTILLKNKVEINIPDESGEVPLSYFLKSYLFQDITNLIHNGANVNQKINDKYPLQIAIENQDVDNFKNIKALLDAGAKSNFRILSWQYDSGIYEDQKMTLLDKIKELYHQGDVDEQKEYRKILTLLKRYGAENIKI
jgi:hypothetical protein